MPLVDVNQKPTRTSKPAPRSPAAASLQPLVDVFNRLGALGSWDGVGRKGDVSRGLGPAIKEDRADARWFYGSQYTHTPEEGRIGPQGEICVRPVRKSLPIEAVLH